MEIPETTIDRANIMQDIVSLCRDEHVMGSLLNFYNEPILDLDGVKRETFTLFWEKVLPIYLTE